MLHSSFEEGYTVDIIIFRKLADGTTQQFNYCPLDDVSGICNLKDERTSLVLSFGKPYGSFSGNNAEVTARFSADSMGYFSLGLDAQTPEQLHEFAHVFQSELGLVAAPPYHERVEARAGAELVSEKPPLIQVIEDLLERVKNLEEAHTTPAVLTCFVSYQFDGISLQYGQNVKHFLEILGLKVITGQGYEPRPINEKVRGRLNERIDLVVVIEVAGRKSSWTRDEMARAQDPGVFLVPLVEEGAEFDRGIFGDHEHIPFAKGHVSDAFIGLLEGIHYVQRVRATS